MSDVDILMPEEYTAYQEVCEAITHGYLDRYLFRLKNLVEWRIASVTYSEYAGRHRDNG